MDSSIAAGIAAGAALLSSALTGLITYKVAAREQRGRDFETFSTALGVTVSASFGSISIQVTSGWP
jgi:hypothetical protein